MEEMITIPSDKFQKGELQVVCLSPVAVKIYLTNGQTDSFQTQVGQTSYALGHPLNEIDHVEVSLVEGQQYDFLPAINAL